MPLVKQDMGDKYSLCFGHYAGRNSLKHKWATNLDSVSLVQFYCTSHGTALFVQKLESPIRERYGKKQWL
jgi:hypothetical protein